MRVILVRHGEADNNTEERYNSNPKHPAYFVAHVTEKGKTQIRTTAQQLLHTGFSAQTIAQAFVSPLPRAIESAQILQKMGIIHDFIIDDRLIEVNMGDRDGHRYDEYPEDSWDHTKASEYHGELDSDVQKRMCAALADAQKKYPGKTVLFLTHGTPALTLIEYCTGEVKRLNHGEYQIISGV